MLASHSLALDVMVVAQDDAARRAITASLGEDPAFGSITDGAPDDRLLLLATAPNVLLHDLGADGDQPLPAGDVPLVALAPDVGSAREVLEAGARAVLRRGRGGERLRAALRAVAAGLTVIDEGFEGALRPAEPPRGVAELLDEVIEPLTPREQQVLDLLAEGLSNREIAGVLDIGERTAKFHVAGLLDKLGAATRTEAVVRAARLGILLL